MPVTVTPQPTPNPNAMKFVLDRVVAPSGSRSFNSAAEAAADPVAAALFGIAGVKSVFFLNDFITVSKDGGADWAAIVLAAEAVIRAGLE